ncbi:MAG: SusC/RagA family TonB-linked outer membrane protein [Paludibacter sp.]
MKNKKNITGMIGNYISFKNLSLVLFFTFSLSVQPSFAGNDKPESVVSFTVRGLVRDAHTKIPINAAEIVTLNGDASASTNEKGVFKIKVNSKNAILKVSAYDFNIREVSVQGKDSVTIDMYSDVFSNYYELTNGVDGSKDNILTISSLKTVNNLNNSTAVTADELVQTELGGDVRAISRSGVAGMGASLFIRGLNSINANAQPLFVVDGVVWNNMYDVESIHSGFFSNPLDNIDVNDIESISVLKDGLSIYGSKASNGVILIKTKRGNSTVTKINLNIVTGVSTVPNTIPVMNGDAFKTYVSGLLKTTNLTNTEVSQLPYLNDNPTRSTYNIYHNNTNWADQVYQNGISKSYSINVNGGDEKALYYLTLGYMGNSGVVKTTDMERYNLRLNADIKITEAIDLGVNVGFSRIDRVLVDDGVDNYTSPTWLSLTKSPFLSPYNFTSLGTETTEYSYSDIFGIGNPGAIIDNSNNTMKQNSFNITLKPTIKLSPAFTFSEQFDYNLNKTNEDYYRPYLYTEPIFILGIGFSENERRSQVIRNTSIFSETRLNYEKQFDVNNKLNAFIGTRYIFDSFESDYVEGHNSRSNSSVNLLGSFTNLKTDGANNIIKSLSHFINADYSFDNRYFLNASMSIDGSSRFGNETKSGFQFFGHSWGVFPSLNGAWLISSEEFMRNAKAINVLKLRAGYSITGNDDIHDYQTNVYFSTVKFKDVAMGAVLTNLANPQIQWETTGRANVGLDMGLLNDRLSLSVDLYSGKTTNLLVLKEFQDVAGLKSYWGNGGEMSNNGIEFSANAKLVNLKNFHWEMGLSMGHYINKITKLPIDLYSSTNPTNGGYTTSVYEGEILTALGNPAGVFYGYKTLGVFATKAQAEQANLKILNNDGSYSTFGAGDVIFEDVPNANGVKDGIIDAKDKQIIGNPNPTVYGTLTNKLSYKKLTLTALFTYSYGNDVYNYQRSQLEAGKDNSNQSTIMLSRWTSEGQVTNQPQAVFGDPMGNSRFSDRWIEDGSYLRLKTLSLSYSIPIKSTFIDGVNIWLSANNVFTLTKYLGADPEFSTNNAVLYQGVDAGLVPLSKSYYLGIRLNL